MLATQFNVWSDFTSYVIVLCVILLAVAAILYLTSGRKQQQIQAGRDWREVLPELPVAVAGKYFHRRYRVTSREFIATLMSLQNEGVLTVRSSKAIIDREKAAGLKEPVSSDALKLFEILANVDGVVLLPSIYEKITDRKVKDKLDTAYSKWKDVVDRVAKDIEPAVSMKGKMKQVLKYLSYALILLALVAFNSLGLIASLAFLISGLAILGISSIIKEDLSQVELATKELYEWLVEPASDESLLQDEASWNQLLIYAKAFGVENETLNRMKTEAPQLANDSQLISLGFWEKFEAIAFRSPN